MISERLICLTPQESGNFDTILLCIRRLLLNWLRLRGGCWLLNRGLLSHWLWFCSLGFRCTASHPVDQRIQTKPALFRLRFSLLRSRSSRRALLRLLSRRGLNPGLLLRRGLSHGLLTLGTRSGGLKAHDGIS